MGYALWMLVRPFWRATPWGRRSWYRQEYWSYVHGGVPSERANVIARELTGYWGKA